MFERMFGGKKRTGTEGFVQIGALEGLAGVLGDFRGGLGDILEMVGGPRRECDCPKCKSYFWEKDDMPSCAIQFERSEQPIFVYLPQHSSKVEKLFSLKRALENQEHDRKIWSEILESKDSKRINELKDFEMLQRFAMKIISMALSEEEDKQKFVDDIDTFGKFVDIMIGNIATQNSVLISQREKFQKMVLEDRSEEIQKKIEEVKMQLPENLRDVKETLRIKIPVEVMDAFAKDYAQKTAEAAAQKATETTADKPGEEEVGSAS